MKKLISIALCLMLTFSASSGFGAYLYTEKYDQKINGAVKYEQRNILTENGWIRAYIAYVDLTNPNASVKVLTSSQGSSYLSTVKQMAADNGADIAIKGDFFNFSSSQTNMLGMVYQNGHMISSPAPDNMVTFALTDKNEAVMDYFSFSSKVISPQGYSCDIYQINKMPVDTGAVTMLNSAWAQKSAGGSYKELIVENDVVKAIRQSGEPAADIPKNGYVLATNPYINAFFDNFSVGDVVTVETTLSPNIENIKEATGGNTLIVKDGAVCNFTSNITGYAQRSSVGVTADGKTLILAATDGRQTDCRGLTQKELAEFMISLGAHKAINLDGGGSTTFVMKNQSGVFEVKNKVASQRKVSTSIGVFDNKLKGTSPVSGKLNVSRKVIIPGDSAAVNAVFYDEYGNEISVDTSKIVYTDDAWNALPDAIYTPEAPGVRKLYASYGDIWLETEIKVTDSLYSFDISDRNITLKNGESVKPDIFAYDSDGERLQINPYLLNFESDSENASVSADGTITASGDGQAIVSVSYGDIKDYITVNKNSAKLKAPRAVTAADPFCGVTDNVKATFAVSGEVPKGATLINKFFSLRRIDRLKAYTKSYVLGSYYADSFSGNTSAVTGYSAVPSDSSLFVTLNTKDSSFSAYKNLVSVCTSVLSGNKNIVVIATSSLSDMNAEDGNRLKNILNRAVEIGSNVFYVYPGDRTEVSLTDGIRFIKCAPTADYRVASFDSDAKYCSYPVFYVNGDEIKYSFVSDY